MKFIFLIREAIQAVRSNVLRSVLTIIGIVVGIFSVTAMLALGEGLSQNVLDRFSSFAQGDITVSGEVTYADVAWIRTRTYVTNTLASQQLPRMTTVAFNTDFSPTILTVVGDYADIQKYTLEEGEVFPFDDVEYSEAVAVVSDGFADAVKEETGRTVLEQPLTIDGKKFTIIGIISSNSPTFTRNDGVILVPFGATVGTLTNSKNFTSVGILLQDSSYFEVAGEDILAGLNMSRQLERESDDVFSVETSQTFIESAQQTTQMMSLFLGIVGSIALFVGGIGTMNMMLTTVTERTKEIGLRKAIGARNRDILIQILIESVLLTTFGGLIGILLSLGGAKIANQILANNPLITILVNTKVVFVAAVVSLLVGVVFGLYPARNASKLQPVDALRAE